MEEELRRIKNRDLSDIDTHVLNTITKTVNIDETLTSLAGLQKFLIRQIDSLSQSGLRDDYSRIRNSVVRLGHSKAQIKDKLLKIKNQMQHAATEHQQLKACINRQTKQFKESVEAINKAIAQTNSKAEPQPQVAYRDEAPRTRTPILVSSLGEQAQLTEFRLVDVTGVRNNLDRVCRSQNRECISKDVRLTRMESEQQLTRDKSNHRLSSKEKINPLSSMSSRTLEHLLVYKNSLQNENLRPQHQKKLKGFEEVVRCPGLHVTGLEAYTNEFRSDKQRLFSVGHKVRHVGIRIHADKPKMEIPNTKILDYRY